VLIISVFCLPSIVGCSGGSDLSRSMARDLVLSNSEYPREITKGIWINRTIYRINSQENTYVNELNASGLATAQINNG